MANMAPDDGCGAVRLQGDTGFKVFKTRFANIGVAICWDQWFPECARAMALQGAEVLLCVPSHARTCAWASIAMGSRRAPTRVCMYAQLPDCHRLGAARRDARLA